jgi:hypothetical protein
VNVYFSSSGTRDWPHFYKYEYSCGVRDAQNPAKLDVQQNVNI